MVCFTSIQKIKKIPIHNYLSRKEIDIYEKIPLIKRDDWLAGRFAAKKVIRLYFLKKFRPGFNLKDIEIVNRKFQKPTYEILRLPRRKDEIYKEIKYNTNICLSHSAGMGAATIANAFKDGFTGVDIEKIRNFTPAILNSFLTQKEKAALNKQPACDKPKLATLFWCVKEAYLKAIGKGLLYHPKFIEARLNIKKNFCEIYDKGRKISANIQWSIFKKDYIIVKVNAFNL